MTPAQYCSTVCEAACCRKRPPFVSPDHCPQLTRGNTCSIYETRIGFTFAGRTGDGLEHPCSCLPIAEALPLFPASMREKCCYENPELLEE